MPACVIASESVGDRVGLAPGAAVLNSSAVLARPKSSIFTAPAGVILMLAGFRSRWMMPCSCAASRPSAICRAMGRASSSGSGPLQVGALDQLHHQRALLDAVDGSDVGMIQRRQHLRFALEARHVLRVAGQGGGQHLDGDVAFELGVAGAIDLAHAARAEGREDLIGAEFGAGGESHFLRSLVQFKTTVMGEGGAVRPTTRLLIRNLFPSAVASYRVTVRVGPPDI